MRALVVDDARAVRTILREMLGDLGFEVYEAADGCEAVARLRAEGEPDLILVDWNMPCLNGPDVVRALRTELAYTRVPVVMVTTEHDLAHVTEALEAGASEYVMKPFTAEVIRDKLRMVGLPIPEEV